MDPIRTAIMNNRFTAIVEEASATLRRTAHTTFVKLVQDYQCAIATAKGEIFAYPTQSGVSAFIGLSMEKALDRFGRDNLEPGDCLITNDPFGTDGLVTHMMDVTMLRPIFRDGRMIAVAWCFVHASDIGGAVPGSISPGFAEVFQEGLRVRPMKLFRAGVLNPDVRDIFLDNSRIPDDMWGDFQAMLSALKSMDRRLNELCARYGTDAVCAGMEDVIDFAEAKARAVIAGIPDGSYEFGDYIEGFEDGDFTYVRARVTVRGDTMECDFAGTDPQIPAAYNMVAGDRPHPYVLMVLLHYFLTMEPAAPRNAGLLRPITMNAPRGTVVNAVHPAAGGARVASSMRVYDSILGCLDQALPDGLMAAGSGMTGIIVVSGRDPSTGRNRVSTINPICGGGGGRIGSDGVDGVDARSSMLATVPAEITEIETVMLLRSVQVVPDSQAPGRWRSGAAIAMEMENTGFEATMTVRGMNRFHMRPWGVKGGAPGRLAEVILNPGTPDARSIGKINVLKLKRGEAVRIISPSGGGFGDPLTRDLDLVRRDLDDGVVTPAHARDAYGVVTDAAGAIDADATRRLRAERRADGPPPLFALGPEREAYDRIWPAAVRKVLAERALAADFAVRQHLVKAVRARLTARGLPVDLATLEHAIADELAELSGTKLRAAGE